MRMKKAIPSPRSEAPSEPEIAVCFRLPAKVVHDLRRASERLGYDQTEFVRPVILAGLAARIKELEAKRRKELDSSFKLPLAPASHNALVAA